MKKLTSFFLALALILAPCTFSGCAILGGGTATEKAADIQALASAAASLGTQVALLQNPEWRPKFELAYNDLNQLVESKVVTGFLLRQILSTLPVKELKSDTARISIETATMLYDIYARDQINIERSPYVLAAATGIRDGMKFALGK